MNEVYLDFIALISQIDDMFMSKKMFGASWILGNADSFSVEPNRTE